MAATQHSTHSSAQQPGLRSFIVYDHVPAGWLTFQQVGDESEPHLSHGDTVLVDATDFEPQHGELFLIEWESSNRREIVLVEHNPKWNGWLAGPVRGQRVTDVYGRGTERVRFVDGPYRAENLAKKLIGKVVGIYEPQAALVRRAA